MARLSVTLDERTTDELHELPGSVKRTFSLFEEEELVCFFIDRPRVLLEVTRALRDAGNDPSASATLRYAAKAFVSLAHDLEQTALLERGYAALAEDSERAEVLPPLVGKAIERWANEP